MSDIVSGGPAAPGPPQGEVFPAHIENAGVSEDGMASDAGAEVPQGSPEDEATESGREGDDGAPGGDDEHFERLEEAREDALDFLEGLLDAMDIDGDLEAVIEGNSIQVSIFGEGSGLLIGRRGQTLGALEELLRAAVRRKAEAPVRISLDIEDYRVRRRAALQEQAAEVAQRAIAEGEVELEPMPAFERKIVHDAVADIKGVTSFSEGEEPRRRVIIARED